MENNKINEAIASRLNKLPPQSIDQAIINKSKTILREETNYMTMGLSFASMAMMTLLIFNISKIPNEPNLPKGSEEMVAYYQEIEVMASLGELSDRDLELALKE